MQYIHLKNILPGGELLKRAEMNYNRLETEEYRVPSIFKESQYSWPGDWEGRTILALVLLAQSTRRSPLFLDKILSELPGRLNDMGFFGKLPEEGIADEQQISGNSWFLRSLCELYEWKHEEEILEMIKSIVNNLLIHLQNLYLQYPIHPSERHINGQAIGELSGEIIQGWRVSSDIGCAFIMLDGATHAWSLLKSAELTDLIRIMIKRYFECDHAGSNFQTHATLSALRGVIRFMSNSGCVEEYLPEVVRIFKLYCTTAMTENGENYSWFNLPSWTEGCAVTDSFIIAAELWRITRDDEWLDLLHHIVYNGFFYNQRPNGGFGCDTCVRPEESFLKPHPDLYEAYWCCTMRGGEGLARLCTHMVAVEDQSIYLPYPSDGHIEAMIDGKTIMLEERSGYPEFGSIRLTVVSSEYEREINLAVYVGKYIKSVCVKIDGSPSEFCCKDSFVCIRIRPEKGRNIEISYDTDLHIEYINDDRMFKLMHGPLLLAQKTKNDLVCISDLKAIRNEKGATYITNSERLFPVREMSFRTDYEMKNSRLQVLFRENVE